MWHSGNRDRKLWLRLSLLALLPGPLVLLSGRFRTSDAEASHTTETHTTAIHTPEIHTKAEAVRTLQRLPGFFVPNLGQWKHPARFVHRSGPSTLFLQDRGWMIHILYVPADRPVNRKAALRESGSFVRHPIPGKDVARKRISGVALTMTFEGDRPVPEIIGEDLLPGHHNYFLGSDESRWRTRVPLYASVRYKSLYRGIDLRLCEKDGVPEYDLLLQPGADLSRVAVRVDGAQGMRITEDGSLRIDTALGPLIQPLPKTWQVGSDGIRRTVTCSFVLLSAMHFGFVAPGWDDQCSLTIDPGLIWSTALGGAQGDRATALSVDSRGIVTVAGSSTSLKFPTTNGAYDRTYNGGLFVGDSFISRLDPSKTGSAQLVYSTFLGGSSNDSANAIHVDGSGVVTVAGGTGSTRFPVTSGAFDASYNGNGDAFVSRLDPSKVGSAQLVYSTFLGGNLPDSAVALCVDASGVTTVAGTTSSSYFPTTKGAYDRTISGSKVFVSRLHMGIALYADTHEVSLRQGGRQTLVLNAGKAHANKAYLLLGTLGGTRPGIALGNNVNLPLNLDAYFTITLAYPNAVLLTGSSGKLDASGMAISKFTASSLIPTALIGQTFHHAYVVVGSSPFDFASNAVPAKLVK